METEQLGLFGLPSRGIMGVVEGFKALPAGPGSGYICCQQLSPTVIVRNPAVRLVDLYKLSARTKPGSTTPAAPAVARVQASAPSAAAAAAGGSGSKRPAGQLQLDDKAAKRQQQRLGKEPTTTGPAAHPQQQQQQQQQQQAGAGAGARGSTQQQKQQQQRGAVPQPLTALPNATNVPTAAAAAAAAGSCTASKQLLQYTPEQMMMFSNKRLTELLKSCGLKVAGKKEELVRRLMEYQRRVRKAAQASSTAVPQSRGVRA